MTRTLASAVLLFAASAAAGQLDGRRPFIPPKDANFELFRGLLHFYGVEPVSADELATMRDRDFDKVIVVGDGTTSAHAPKKMKSWKSSPFFSSCV